MKRRLVQDVLLVVGILCMFCVDQIQENKIMSLRKRVEALEADFDDAK